MNEEQLVQHASDFAYDKHHGQYRKSTELPFFAHLNNVATTLGRYGARDEVVAAGYLHDVVEDTGDAMTDSVTFNEVETVFGEEVRYLVEGASEHTKDASWAERKQHTINYLQSEAPADVIKVTTADKLDNVRSLQHDLQRADDPYNDVWSNFTVSDIGKQAWYYDTIADIAEDTLTDEPWTHLADEYSEAVDDVFDGVEPEEPEQ